MSLHQDMPEATPPPASPAVSCRPPATLVLDPTDAIWGAILSRDAGQDGRFVYAVRSTGIFCRPSCPSRRPLRRSTMIFRSAQLAVEAGFRACLRCHPMLPAAPAGPYARVVERATAWLNEAEIETASPATLADAAEVSPVVLRRSFQQVLGVTPAQFLRTRRLDRFRTEMRPGPRQGASPVTAAVHNAGFGSTSRLYEQSAATLGMTPTSLLRGAKAETIWYTVAESPLGRTLVATTARGICAICFADSDAELLAELYGRFPRATLLPVSADADCALPTEQQPWLAEAVRFVLSQLSEHPLAAAFPTDVRATAFQHRVWAALQGIPRGTTVTYAALAERLGQPTATRAVAAACARNPLALFHPCHRVVGSSGRLTGYRWGLARKQQVLDRERAAANPVDRPR